jgi:hypothetical protein
VTLGERAPLRTKLPVKHAVQIRKRLGFRRANGPASRCLAATRADRASMQPPPLPYLARRQAQCGRESIADQKDRAMLTQALRVDDSRSGLESGATDFLPERPQAVAMVRLRNLIRLGLAVRRLNDRAADLANEVAAATRKLQEREEEIILRPAPAVEYRDNDTGGNTPCVAKYSRRLAEALGFPARLCRDIYLAAPLHDVGKIAIPDRILLKPGRLESLFSPSDNKTKGHAGITPHGLCETVPPGPSRDSVSGRIVCGWRCLSRV